MSSLSSLLGPYATQALSPAAPAAVSPFSVPAISMWIAVRQRCAQFHANLTLTPLQFLDGVTKRNGVVNCLNRHYHHSVSETDNSFLIGSWGKDTAIRLPA